MSVAVMMMYCDLGAPVACTLLGSDARGPADDRPQDHGAYGVVGATISQTDAWEVFEKGLTAGLTVARLSGDISNLRNPGKELARRTPFSRIPHHIFDPEQTNWIPIAHGKWRFNDHITLGEGRASMVAVEGIVKDVRAHRHIILSLQDNMAWSGASSKGRSTAPAMNFLLRRRASLSLLSEIKVPLPWCESNKQPADGLSRL